jgi:hypothetical protein
MHAAFLYHRARPFLRSFGCRLGSSVNLTPTCSVFARKGGSMASDDRLVAELGGQAPLGWMYLAGGLVTFVLLGKNTDQRSS